MSAGVKKPNITTLDVTLDMDLAAFMKISPADPCPDVECDGHISNVRMTWDISGIDCYGECSQCLEKWPTIEKPSYQDVLEEENANASKEKT